MLFCLITNTDTNMTYLMEIRVFFWISSIQYCSWRNFIYLIQKELGQLLQQRLDPTSKTWKWGRPITPGPGPVAWLFQIKSLNSQSEKQQTKSKDLYSSMTSWSSMGSWEYRFIYPIILLGHLVVVCVCTLLGELQRQKQMEIMTSDFIQTVKGKPAD